MSIPLVDALRMVNLEPGCVYRERVDGKTFVVQLLAESDDEPTPELADQVMLLPWFESPVLPGGRVITVARGEPMVPDPPIIPDDEAIDLPDPIVIYGSRSAAGTDPTAAPSSTSGT